MAITLQDQLRAALQPTLMAMRQAFVEEAEIYMAIRNISMPQHMPQDVADKVFQFWGRTEVRMVFAQLEGLTHSLKQAALDVSQITGVALTPEEVLLLQEKEYDLRQNGAINEKSARLRTLPNFLFAFKTFAKVCGVNHQLNLGGREYQQLQNALDVRDRLTHPRSVTSLEVTHEELGAMFAALTWVYSNLDTVVGLAIGTPAQSTP